MNGFLGDEATIGVETALEASQEDGGACPPCATGIRKGTDSRCASLGNTSMEPEG